MRYRCHAALATRSRFSSASSFSPAGVYVLYVYYVCRFFMLACASERRSFLPRMVRHRPVVLQVRPMPLPIFNSAPIPDDN